MIDTDDIRSRVTIADALALLGEETPARGEGKVNCLFHEDRTPSMHVWSDHFYSFCCGKGGDVIELVMSVTGYRFKEAAEMLGGKASELSSFKRAPIVPREVHDFTAEFKEKGTLTSIGLDYLIDIKWPGLFNHKWLMYEYGVRTIESPATAIIPHWEGSGHTGRIVGVKTRSLAVTDLNRKSAWKGSTFTSALYSSVPLGKVRATRVAYIVEGESDCWALQRRVDADVFALPSGAGAWRDHWVDQHGLWMYRLILVATDMDEAGDRAADRITSVLGNAVRHRLPEVDVADSLLAGWTPPFDGRL